ncbi:MAG: lambda-exonuclease family protein [Phycisphaerae bacterium]
MKSPEWLAKWNKTIGGSRAAAVAGKSPWDTPANVYDEMRGEKPPRDLSDNPDVRRGLLLEPVAAAQLEEQIGRPVRHHNQEHFVYNNNLPFAHTLPDAWLGIAEPVELKVPRPQTWQRMYLQGIPDHYTIQAQHCMAITDAKVVHFAALCPVTMAVLYVPIERDQPFIDDLMSREEEFYNAVLAGNRPADDDRAPEIEVPQYDGAICTIGGEQAERAAKAYIEAKAVQEDVTEIVADAKQRLLDIAGDADAFEVPGILRCYHRYQDGRRTFDHKAAVLETPALERYYKTGKAFKTFRAYPIRKGRP